MEIETLIWSVTRTAKVLKLQAVWDDCLKKYGKYNSATVKAEYLYQRAFEREYAKKKFMNEGFKNDK